MWSCVPLLLPAILVSYCCYLPMGLQPHWALPSPFLPPSCGTCSPCLRCSWPSSVQQPCSPPGPCSGLLPTFSALPRSGLSHAPSSPAMMLLSTCGFVSVDLSPPSDGKILHGMTLPVFVRRLCSGCPVERHTGPLVCHWVSGFPHTHTHTARRYHLCRGVILPFVLFLLRFKIGWVFTVDFKSRT